MKIIAKLKSYSVIVFLLILSINTHAQKMYNVGQLSDMVVYIGDDRGKVSQGLGTGTIVSDSTTYYLVTAAHISDSIKGSCFLVFRKDGDIPVKLPLAAFINNGVPNWKRHNEADISVLKINAFNADVAARFKNSSFSIRNIVNSKEAVPRDFNVVSIGYPVLDEIGQHFSALIFNSFFSSGLITLKRGDTKTLSNFQLLENPSVQGYSGGPIFISVMKGGMVYGPDKTLLVGIMHGTLGDNTGGKIAMVTPAYYIHDLIK